MLPWVFFAVLSVEGTPARLLESRAKQRYMDPLSNALHTINP